MELQAKTFGDVLVLSVVGRIDHNTADGFREALMPHIEGANDKIALDMQHVDYMSSVGLRVLMLAAKAGKKDARKIIVAELQPTMKEIFEISRFNMVFDTYDSVRDALDSVSEEALAEYDRG